MRIETSEELSGEIIAKLGGSSVDDQQAVAEFLESHPHISIVVNSSPKFQQENGDKATDFYIRYGHEAMRGRRDTEAHEIVRESVRHTFRGLGSLAMTTILDDLDDQMDITKHAGKDLAWYASIGENISAKASAALHGGRFVDSMIVFDRSKVEYEKTIRKIIIARMSGELAVGGPRIFKPGYYGYDKDGNRRLLGRGGSDRTGALYAVATVATYYNCTDVDGIFSGNPKIIPNAKLLSEVTRREVREGAHGGSGVLQGDTIKDLQHEYAVLVYLRSTFKPAERGTLISVDRDSSKDRRPVVAVSGKRLAEITVEDMGMADEEGYLARVDQYAAEAGLSLELSPSAQDAFTYTMAFPDKEIDQRRFRRQLEAFRNLVDAQTVSVDARVEVNDEKGVIYLVGDQLRDRDVARDTLEKALGSLRRENISLDASVGHPSSPSLALLVDHEDVNKGLQVIHRDLIEH